MVGADTRLLLSGARLHPLALGVNVCIVGQYITDLLDGAVGRARNTGLKLWGYYVDHFLDYIFLGAIFFGYAVLLPAVYHKMILFTLIMFAGFMVHAFLEFACTNRFRISYLGIGPNEVRLLFIVINVLLIVFGKTHLRGGAAVCRHRLALRALHHGLPDGAQAVEDGYGRSGGHHERALPTTFFLVAWPR